jgi:hypothetical protein
MNSASKIEESGWAKAFYFLWHAIATDERLLRTPRAPVFKLSDTLEASACAQIRFTTERRPAMVTVSSKFAEDLRADVRKCGRTLSGLAAYEGAQGVTPHALIGAAHDWAALPPSCSIGMRSPGSLPRSPNIAGNPCTGLRRSE